MASNDKGRVHIGFRPSLPSGAASGRVAAPAPEVASVASAPAPARACVYRSTHAGQSPGEHAVPVAKVPAAAITSTGRTVVKQVAASQHSSSSVVSEASQATQTVRRVSPGAPLLSASGSPSLRGGSAVQRPGSDNAAVAPKVTIVHKAAASNMPQELATPVAAPSMQLQPAASEGGKAIRPEAMSQLQTGTVRLSSPVKSTEASPVHAQSPARPVRVVRKAAVPKTGSSPAPFRKQEPPVVEPQGAQTQERTKRVARSKSPDRDSKQSAAKSDPSSPSAKSPETQKASPAKPAGVPEAPKTQVAPAPAPSVEPSAANKKPLPVPSPDAFGRQPYQPSAPNAQLVQYDDNGFPMVERHRDPDTDEPFTLVWYEDGTKHKWERSNIAEIAEMPEAEMWQTIKDMSYRTLRGFVHEASMQVVEGSSEYHSKKEKLEEMGGQVDHVFFGLTPDACIKDLEAAYRRLARAMHPDKNRDVPDAKEQFQAMKARYERLITKMREDGTPLMSKTTVKKEEEEKSKKRPEALEHQNPFGEDEEPDPDDSLVTPMSSTKSGRKSFEIPEGAIGEMDERGWIRQEPLKPQPAGKSLKVEFIMDDGSEVNIKARNFDMMWTRNLDGKRVARKFKKLVVEEGDSCDEFVLHGPFGVARIVEPPPPEQMQVVRQMVCLLKAYKMDVSGSGLENLENRQVKTPSSMGPAVSQKSPGGQSDSSPSKSPKKESQPEGRREAYDEDEEKAEDQGPTVERVSFDFNDLDSLRGMALKMMRQMKILLRNSDILNEKFRKMDEEAESFHGGVGKRSESAADAEKAGPPKNGDEEADKEHPSDDKDAKQNVWSWRMWS